jgi:hypothetical protein
VVLEGDPCKTSSYKLKKCIGFTDQADSFAVLDSLTLGEEYLINVDGFLGDACSFDISLKSEPSGLPVQVPIHESKTFRHTQLNSIVTLHWTIDQSDADILKEFIIYRKRTGDPTSMRLKAPSPFNALGSAALDYSLSDTLHLNGEYVYSIFMHSTQRIVQLPQVKIQHPLPTSNNINNNNKSFPQFQRHIDFYAPEAGMVKISILTKDQKTIYSFRKKCTRGQNIIVLDFSPLMKTGEKQFIVTFKNNRIDEGRAISFD